MFTALLLLYSQRHATVKEETISVATCAAKPQQIIVTCVI